jgi:hypothetical protein
MDRNRERGTERTGTIYGTEVERRLRYRGTNDGEHVRVTDLVIHVQSWPSMHSVAALAVHTSRCHLGRRLSTCSTASLGWVSTRSPAALGWVSMCRAAQPPWSSTRRATALAVDAQRRCLGCPHATPPSWPSTCTSNSRGS